MLEPIEPFRLTAKQSEDGSAFARTHSFAVFVVQRFAEIDDTNTFTRLSRLAGNTNPADVAVAPIVKRPGANRMASMVTIGRARTNDIELKSAEVSKVHAYIRFGPDGTVLLTDSHSTNGTFVRGERINPKESVVLRDGDEVMIGVVPMTFHTSEGFFERLKTPGDGS